MEVTHDNNVVCFTFMIPTNAVSVVKLVHCMNVVQKNVDIDTSYTKTGNICLASDNQEYEVQKVDCEYFCTEIYRNGVKILFSKSKSLTNLKCSSVIFTFDSTDGFVGISIIELNKNEMHMA